jgi:hypothetical protein
MSNYVRRGLIVVTDRKTYLLDNVPRWLTSDAIRTLQWQVQSNNIQCTRFARIEDDMLDNVPIHEWLSTMKATYRPYCYN